MDKNVQLPVVKILEDVTSMDKGVSMLLNPAAFYEGQEYTKTNDEQVQVSHSLPLLLLKVETLKFTEFRYTMRWQLLTLRFSKCNTLQIEA